MDFDFSLVLVALVSFTGFVYLIDIVFFLPKRKKALAVYQAESGDDVDAAVAEQLMQEPLWIEYPKSFFPVLMVVFVLRSFLVEPFTIPSGSMRPTLLEGDYILVNKFSYGLRVPVLGYKFFDFGDPERGDIMVFRFPEDPRINFIKRVIGEPGDEIRYEDKHVFINGEMLPEELVAELPPYEPFERFYKETIGDVVHQARIVLHGGEKSSRTWKVPEGHYFMMGDNRDNSRDSRAWGYVPERNIVGRAFAIWMHKPNGMLSATFPSFSRNGSIE